MGHRPESRATESSVFRPTAIAYGLADGDRDRPHLFPQPLPMDEHIDVVPSIIMRSVAKSNMIALYVTKSPWASSFSRSSWSFGIMSEARSDKSFFTYAWRSDSTA